MGHDESDLAVEVEGLTRTYYSNTGELLKANDDIGFAVRRGEIFGLLGANGAGKTTLVMQLLGLVQPTSGLIRVGGVDVVRNPDTVKTFTGFLPQTDIAMRMLEVRRALLYTGRLRGQDGSDAHRQVDEIIDELGLGAFADRYVHKLSGGMTRLANLGMALMGRPRLLVLDEPTNELDPHNRRVIWAALERRSAEEGTTVLLVTHNVHEAERAVHRVAIMSRGKLVAQGTPGELKGALGSEPRVELVLRDGEELSVADRSALAVAGRVEDGTRSGTHLIHAHPDRTAELIHILTNRIGLARLDDFRLARPSLEDVYLRFAGTTPTLLAEVTTEAAAGAAPGAVVGSVPTPEASEGADSRAAHEETAVPVGVLAAVASTAERPGPPAPGLTSRPGNKPAPTPREPTGPPAARPSPGRRSLTAFRFLFCEQMLQIRNTWLWSLVLGIFMPLGMVFGFTRIGDAASGGEKLLFIVSGAAVFSVAAEGIMSLAQRVGAIKSTGMLVYYASLPISKGAFIAALVLSRMLLVIPGLMTPILVARFVLGEDFSISPVLLVLFPLTGLTLSAFGMAIGSFIEQPEVIAIATNLLVYVLLLASPVLIPADSLPAPLRFLGYLLPPTYAAEALRFSLRGDLGAGFLLDLAVLTVMAGATLTLAGRWIRWRVA